jgi:hypothetical protein
MHPEELCLWAIFRSVIADGPVDNRLVLVTNPGELVRPAREHRRAVDERLIEIAKQQGHKTDYLRSLMSGTQLGRRLWL